MYLSICLKSECNSINSYMFIRTEQTVQYFMRKGVKGEHHPYKRNKTLVYFKCDNCSEEFVRDKGRIDPKRLCDDYSHVCPKCDPKRFAQKPKNKKIANRQSLIYIWI